MGENKKKIVIDEERCPPEGEIGDMDSFRKALPESEPRYAVLDVHHGTDDGRPQEKLCFVAWSPDDKCGVKDRMLYAASKDAFKRKFGTIKDIQANSPDDLTDGNIIAKAKS